MEKSSSMQLKGRSKRRKKERNQVGLCLNVCSEYFLLSHLDVFNYYVLVSKNNCWVQCTNSLAVTDVG